MGRFRTLQNLVDVGGGLPVEISNIWFIGHQATGVSDLDRVRVHRRQSVAGREFAHSCTLSNEYALGRRKKPFGPLSGSSLERGRKVIGGPYVVDLQSHAQRRRRLLQCLHL